MEYNLDKEISKIGFDEEIEVYYKCANKKKGCSFEAPSKDIVLQHMSECSYVYCSKCKKKCFTRYVLCDNCFSSIDLTKTEKFSKVIGNYNFFFII